MDNKAYCIIKAERAEAKGRKKEAVKWYAEAGRECLKRGRNCQLFNKLVESIILFGGC